MTFKSGRFYLKAQYGIREHIHAFMYTLENSTEVPQKYFKTRIGNLAIQLLGEYPRKVKAVLKLICIPIFTVTGSEEV